MKKVLFVCTGNTCRSPLAEGLYIKFLKDRNIDDIGVSSAGISAFAGDGVSRNSVLAAGELGVDISAHRARRLSQYDMDEADLIGCMAGTHYDYLSRYMPRDKLFLPRCEIPDPYGGDLDEYKKCAELIRACFPDVLNALRGICVTPMAREHVPDVALLEKMCFSSPRSEKALLSELTDKKHLAYVALIDGKLAGYIGADNICGEVNITNVAVFPECREMGAASALLDRLIEDCAGVEFFTLEVRKSNEKAISLYKKYGFEAVGERKGFYTKPLEDAIIMTKKDVNDEDTCY